MASPNKMTTRKQFDQLVEFMEDHPDLARGSLKTPDARQTATALWERIVMSLNASGPPIRDLKDWKKVWCDQKLNTKAKLRRNETGKLVPLTPNEERVLAVLGMKPGVNSLPQTKALNGPPTVRAESETEMDESDDDEMHEPQQQKTKKEYLIAEHLKEQKQMAGSLRKIELSLAALVEVKKKRNSIQEQMVEIARQKLQLKKEIFYLKKGH